MATRGIVPRANGEGSIGMEKKHWGAGYFGTLDTCMRQKAYAVGDIVYSAHLPSWARLECVKAGTTGAQEPVTLATVSAGGTLITDGSAVWIVDDLRDGTPVGAMRGSLYLPAGYIKANGATVQRADYPRLVALADRHNLWTDDTAANAGLFGRGDGSKTMVLPNWSDKMVQFATSAIGTSVSAGLPNITGYIIVRGVGDSGDGVLSGTEADGNGAFSVQKADFVNRVPFSTGTHNDFGSSYKFDASRSNPIYGRGETVQPPAINLIPIIRY